MEKRYNIQIQNSTFQFQKDLLSVKCKQHKNSLRVIQNTIMNISMPVQQHSKQELS